MEQKKGDISFRSRTNYLTNFKTVYVALLCNKQSMLNYLLPARNSVSQVTDNVDMNGCYCQSVYNINILKKTGEMSRSF